jgi:hypothetical protein
MGDSLHDSGTVGRRGHRGDKNASGARLADESGQSSVIMLLLIILFLGVAGFTIDGLRIYLDRRSSQNAADAAVLAGALAICDGQDPIVAATARAADNGYTNSPDQPVRISRPPSSGRFAGDPDYIEVQIVTRTTGSFIRLFYTGILESTSSAIARCNFHRLVSHASLFGGAETCQNTVDWSASDVLVRGDVHSNADIHIGGHINRIEGVATYATTVDAPPGNVVYDPAPPNNPQQVPMEPYPVDFNLSDFAPGGSIAAAAQVRGEFAHCNCRMDVQWLEDHGWYNPTTHELKPGIYYSSDSIVVSADHVNSHGATFVSTGRISLSGSSHNLTPYAYGLLLFSGLAPSGNAACSTPAIRLSGSQNVWAGLMFAPAGAIQVSGASSSTFDGSLIGHTLSLNGSNLLIQENPEYLPPPPPSVSLVQ